MEGNKAYMACRAHVSGSQGPFRVSLIDIGRARLRTKALSERVLKEVGFVGFAGSRERSGVI